MSEEASRLSRWSQRKAAARRGTLPPEPAEEAKAAPPAASSVASIEQDQSASAEGAPAADDVPALPPIEELNFESDYSVFLNAKVPEALRRAALRKLWTSDPVLANLDGLNDYDEDYHLVDTTITAAQTAYRVGRGYVDEIEEKLEQAERVLGDETDAQIDSSEAHDSASIQSAAESVSESDAAGDNSADAPQQVAAAATNAEPDASRKQSGE